MEQVFIISQEQFNTLRTKLESIEQLIGASKDVSNDWVTAKEAMEILGVKETTLWTYRKQGLIQASKIRKKLSFKRSDLIQLLASNKLGK